MTSYILQGLAIAFLIGAVISMGLFVFFFITMVTSIKPQKKIAQPFFRTDDFLYAAIV